MINVGNMDITYSDQSVTLRMRHVVEGHPVCVFSFSEIDYICEQLQAAKKAAKSMPKAAAKEPEDDPFACLAEDPVDLFDGLPLVGTVCSECGLYQRQSRGGEVCKNGHGGVPGLPPETHYWYHPESNSLFTTAPGVEFPTDGLVEHIDKPTFDRISHEMAAESTEDHFDIL